MGKGIILTIVGVVGYFLFSWIVKDIWLTSGDIGTLGDFLEIELYSACIATIIVCVIVGSISSKGNVALAIGITVPVALISYVFATLLIRGTIPLSEGIVVLYTIINLIMIGIMPWVAVED